ncbi:T9SS type B sorting domain-containing protein [Vicingus serpentipes]|uniref:T9SS type B sorting domain-containing protein n=1 Tax=Vicingus serpentipes TaxID=1926625 RepID=A0A5C6RSZ4_9FLAO|nr:gliding motility-associated C-terminal domain-containing protein [Vicingus serpentipes]TXB65247.1 T9SS type B sorting domain-containing protein [Vicingus serpentipes]
MLFFNRVCLIATFVVFTITTVKSQTPSSCFEIESILVDACGSPESDNEMVRFTVGPNNLNYNDMNVSWPTTSNSYDGICKNGTTASKVASLNSTITGCGVILEPTANILPAGASVILFTSTLFDVSANSFANLNDTVYAIFQCPGNTLGHFSNSSSSVKTLTISFSSPAGCSDVVSYLPTDLTGGDGAAVDYTWPGSPTYINNGCTAPIVINTIDINETGFTICPGDTIDLSATINGSFSSTTWIGGNGTFSSNSNSTTSYYSVSTDNSDFYIYYEGATNCGQPTKDSVLVEVGGNTSIATITSSSTELCSGDSILLTASGSGNYTWNTGSTSNSIYVLTSGNYSVTSNSSCGSASDNITITDAPTINLNLTTPNTTICNGNSAVLTASGAPNYTWFNNANSTSQSVSNTGDYYVIGYNNCYRDSQSISITVLFPPTISLSSSSATNVICNGETITLIASGSDNYLWNTSETTSSITVSSIGTYSVSSTNSCGSDSESLIVSPGTLPVASITGDTIICNNVVQLTAGGNGNYLWSTGSNSITQNFSSAANVFLSVTNECGSDTAYKTILDNSITALFSSDYFYGSELPSIINFTNESSLSATNFSWNFGNGQLSLNENPSTSYIENGEYTVTLTASNNNCQDTYQETLLFERPNTVYIPNVFTPNNDFTNDVFTIKGENISSLTCKIFNRWGKELYSWDAIDGSWDGYYEGTLVADGTYFYISTITWNNELTETLTGHITLLK